jgi:hypothetical protein
MEVSYSQKYVLIGGGMDNEQGIATLTAVSFDIKLEHTVSCQAGSSSMNCVYSIRRLKEGNIFFCGGYSSITVIFFDETAK